MNHKILKSSLLLGFVLLSGCTSDLIGPAPNDPRFAPTYPEPPKLVPKKNGTIYQENYSKNMYQDRLARKVGDVLTIHLEENTIAQKKADTKNSKSNQTQFDNPTLLGQVLTSMAINTNTNQTFDSKGESKQSNNLQGNITVTVAQVLPNGNLFIQGESWVNINRGNEFVRLTGIVRQDDIDADNTVSSQRVANARIAYSGTGQVANSNKQGLFSRFFNGYFPF